MLDILQKRKIRSKAYHPVTLAVLLIVVLVALHSTWVVYGKKRTSEKMKNIAQNNLNELLLRQNELDYKMERLKTTEGLEEEIRSKFNVTKIGENMVMVVEGDNSKASTTSSAGGFFQKIWQFLTNHI